MSWSSFILDHERASYWYKHQYHFKNNTWYQLPVVIVMNLPLALWAELHSSPQCCSAQFHLCFCPFFCLCSHVLLSRFTSCLHPWLVIACFPDVSWLSTPVFRFSLDLWQYLNHCVCFYYYKVYDQFSQVCNFTKPKFLVTKPVFDT